MRAPSRTPEGSPGRCGVCGRAFRLEASWPGGDVPCPCCGSLVWVEPPARLAVSPAVTPKPRWVRALRANAGFALAAGFWLAAALLPAGWAPEFVALGVMSLALFWRGIR